MNMHWKCVVCSAVFEGQLPPDICPVCKAGREAFIPFTPETVGFHRDSAEIFMIIGSGAAACSAAEAVRKRNSTATVQIFTRETQIPYFRPVLIRYLSEKIKDREFFMHPAPFYKNRKIEIVSSTEAVSISPSEKTVLFSDGVKRPYDKLLLATGAKNFLPPIPGIGLKNVLAPRELRDFDLLKQSLSEGMRIAVLGGGLLGLETAWTLSQMKCDVTVIEARDRILPRQTDEASSEILSSLISQSGVRLVTSHKVAEIFGGDSVRGLRLDDGIEIPAEIVIVSAGISSEKSLAENAGLKCSKGIVVDPAMTSSDPSIFSAGDCAETQYGTEGIWEASLEQGRIAGANMAGDELRYQRKQFGTVLNSFGTKLFSIGEIPAKDSCPESILSSDLERHRYKAVFIKESGACGGILMGDCSLTCNLIAAIANGWNKAECEANGL